jgi:hypothetical protein
MIIGSLLKILAVVPANCGGSFFGLVPWYHYLSSGPNGDIQNCSVVNFTFIQAGKSSDIPLVLLAVVDDLLHIAGLVAVAFVLYGGFQYVSSQGQPEKTARAQNTVIDALIGLAVAIVAISAVSFLGNKLGG